MWSVIELIETFFCNSYVVGIYERKTIVLFFVPKKNEAKVKGNFNYKSFCIC